MKREKEKSSHQFENEISAMEKAFKIEYASVDTTQPIEDKYLWIGFR